MVEVCRLHIDLVEHGRRHVSKFALQPGSRLGRAPNDGILAARDRLSKIVGRPDRTALSRLRAKSLCWPSTNIVSILPSATRRLVAIWIEGFPAAAPPGGASAAVVSPTDVGRTVAKRSKPAPARLRRRVLRSQAENLFHNPHSSQGCEEGFALSGARYPSAIRRPFHMPSRSVSPVYPRMHGLSPWAPHGRYDFGLWFR